MGGSVSEQRLLALVGRLYDAAFDESLWTGLADEIARTFDAPSTALHVRSAQGDAHLLDVTANLRLTSKAQQEHAAYWRKNDLWVRRAKELGMGRVIVSEDMYPAAVFERSAFYQEWCRHQGQFYIVGSVFELPGGDSGSFGIHRPRDHRPFDAGERRHAEILLQHYRRALEMRRRLQLAAAEQEAARQALAHAPMAMLTVGPDGELLHACPKAEAVLQQADGLRLVGGRVTTPLRRESETLARLIAAAAACASGNELAGAVGQPPLRPLGSAAISRIGRLPLTLLVAPLRLAAQRAASPAALIFLCDPEALSPRRSALMELFGLTAAEATVAAEIAQGHTIEAVARAQHVSLNTARTHLKKVLMKTNTNRQAEAVALILGSSAVLEPHG